MSSNSGRMIGAIPEIGQDHHAPECGSGITQEIDPFVTMGTFSAGGEDLVISALTKRLQRSLGPAGWKTPSCTLIPGSHA